MRKFAISTIFFIVPHIFFIFFPLNDREITRDKNQEKWELFLKVHERWQAELKVTSAMSE